MDIANPLSLAEFLVWEARQTTDHELLDGVIVATSNRTKATHRWPSRNVVAGRPRTDRFDRLRVPGRTTLRRARAFERTRLNGFNYVEPIRDSASRITNLTPGDARAADASV